MTDQPSVEYLRECLRYEPETGKLYWLPRSGVPASWNTKYAGKEAFTAIAQGYRRGLLNYKGYKAHRVAWALYYGQWPEGEIDHINHDRLDNRIENLRVVTLAENQKNKTPYRNNKSGATGVYWNTRASRWCAQIRVAGRGVYLGLFASLKDAVEARKAAETQHNFHSNHGTVS